MGIVTDFSNASLHQMFQRTQSHLMLPHQHPLGTWVCNGTKAGKYYREILQENITGVSSYAHYKQVKDGTMFTVILFHFLVKTKCIHTENMSSWDLLGEYPCLPESGPEVNDRYKPTPLTIMNLTKAAVQWRAVPDTSSLLTQGVSTL